MCTGCPQISGTNSIHTWAVQLKQYQLTRLHNHLPKILCTWKKKGRKVKVTLKRKKRQLKILISPDKLVV